MCGLAGLLKFNSGINSLDIYNVKLMSEEISYRGPDDESYYQDRTVALAFRRLSIIDLKNGKQPFSNANNSIIVMVNGEIYNYKILKEKLTKSHSFKSKSDCEVVLHLYEKFGTKCFEMLEGMYAIAIWDKRKDALILCRDRFGIKPIFYNLTNDRVIFASELKALFKYHDCPKEFNWHEALSDTWISGYPATNLTKPTSMFENIINVEAGTFVEFNLKTKGVCIYKYWDIASIERHNLSINDVKNEYFERLNYSLEQCLISDVDIGLFLSGGIDSISLSYLASNHISNLSTYSVLSKSTFLNEDSKYANLISELLSLNNHQVLFNEDSLRNFDSLNWKSLLWLCESPMCGPEQLYKYHLHNYAKKNNPNLKVILTGQGSDEFNGGYSKLYTGGENKWGIFENAMSYLTHKRKLSALSPSVNLWNDNFEGELFSKKFTKDLKNTKEESSDYYEYVLSKYRDIQMYNSWLEDRIAAGNQIENRVPFLNHKIVELLLGVPDEYYPELFMDKKILRDSFYDKIPNQFVNRPKVPFFYGKGITHTRKIIMNLISKKNYSLIEEAFANQDIINIDIVLNKAKEISNQSELEDTEFLLRLINMGLLNNMAKEIKNKPFSEIKLLPRVIIQSWDKDIKKIKSRLFSDEISFELKSQIVSVPSNVNIIVDEKKPNLIYILINHCLEYTVDKSEEPLWYIFLRELTGAKKINNILTDNKIEYEEIEDVLRECIDLKVLEIQNGY